METVGTNSLFTILDLQKGPIRASNKSIRESESVTVDSYAQLAKATSTLQFRNQDLVLLFRGQGQDYREKRQTTVRPSIFRGEFGEVSEGWGETRKPSLSQHRYEAAFEIVRHAERLLLRHYQGSSIEATRIRRQRIMRWLILQHYEIFPTPLLDVTHSLRIAASFASLHNGGEGYILVIGVPNISGAITASAEAGLQIVRLSSVCPPEASRPHLQEGYLISEYPELGDPRQASLYERHETDVAVRLVAKFKFRKDSFWGNSTDFPQISREALFPIPEKDEFLHIADDIKVALSNGERT